MSPSVLKYCCCCSCCCPTLFEDYNQMEGEITHRTVPVNGINMHVAELGDGPVVLLVHGFPETWYTWRHQIVALAGLGYHCVAPDLRGYGDTEAPSEPNSYSMFHLVGDLVALIDSLSQAQVFVVAHDWGAMVAWSLSQFRPDKVKALVALSVAYTPRNSLRKPVDYLKAAFGDDYYICRFQEPGGIDAEFARLGTTLVLKKFLTYRSPDPLLIPKEGWCSPSDQITLPSWLSQEDINYYADKFDKSGFTDPLNYYRCLNLNWELSSPWTGAAINVPVKFIVGDLDLTYNYPGIQDYIHKGGFKKYVPLLDDVVVMKGVGHFIHEEKPEKITGYIQEFLEKPEKITGYIQEFLEKF